MKMSVVIPMYGCRAAISELHTRLTKSMELITKEYEIIMVNDGCPQKSWDDIEELCKVDKHVIGVELSRNFGQMKAILAGLDIASGDWIVVMDCDLQDRPEEIPNLYAKAMEGYDVVVARRKVRQDSKSKVFFANLFYGVYKWASDGNYDGALCNFSVVKSDVIKKYCEMREQHRSYIMYLQWLGYRHAIVDVEHNDRYEGKSSYDFKKKFAMAFDILTSQSDKVLRYMIRVGLFIAFLSALTIIYLIVHYFTSNALTGWSSTVAIICFIGGVELSAIGIVGIYIGNIFIQVKNRPLYAVRQVLNLEKESSGENC